MAYSELVRNQLNVGKVHAEHVSHDENGILGVAVLGIDIVCADC